MYKWLGMKKISYDGAMDMVRETGTTEGICILHDDNTEAYAYDVAQIKEHNINGGEFGVEMTERECAEWIYERLESYADGVIDILCELRKKDGG